MMEMMGGAKDGDHGGMMQHCMEMMNAMMGGGAEHANDAASMGLNLPLSLAVALILAVALGYLLGIAKRARAQT